MRKTAYNSQQSIFNKITFQHENILNEADFFNLNQSTDSSDIQCSTE